MGIAAAICLGLLGIIVAATVGLMRNRKRARRAGLKAEQINVISNDTRRAFWSSGADDAGAASDSSHSGGDGGSD